MEEINHKNGGSEKGHVHIRRRFFFGKSIECSYFNLLTVTVSSFKLILTNAGLDEKQDNSDLITASTI